MGHHCNSSVRRVHKNFYLSGKYLIGALENTAKMHVRAKNGRISFMLVVQLPNRQGWA
jgi:hypothetical protein